MTLTIGICAHNEEKNIGRLLERLKPEPGISEVLVVSSSTDGTNEAVRAFSEKDARIVLVEEKERRGKSAAINHILSNAKGDIIVLVSADNLPDRSSIQNLVEPFKNADVVAATGRPVPTNDRNTFFGYASHLLWRLHHEICREKPKLSGELFAVRRGIVKEIPADSAVDDASIEVQARRQGRLVYVPAAVTHMRGPENFSDFISQRRRIAFGHLKNPEKAASQDSILVVRSALKLAGEDLGRIHWFLATAALELYARLLARIDMLTGKDHKVWKEIRSTKVV